MSAVPSRRVAVVTGAARGLGQAIAEGLAQRGVAVAGVDVGELSATAAAVQKAGAPWLGVAADVGKPDDVARLEREVSRGLGRCDILINNAAITDPVDWDDLDYERWLAVLQVDLTAAFLMCKAFLPAMKASGWGRVINITSGAVQNPMPRFIAYRAAKMGLIGLTRALAVSVGGDGITVNAVAPGVTRTSMAMGDLSDEMIRSVVDRQAIKRIAEPRDILGVLLFLAGEESYWITGQTIYSAGGAIFG